MGKAPIFFLSLLLFVHFPSPSKDSDVENFKSLKSNEVNVRVGPSGEIPIILTYRTIFLPVKIIAEYDNWYKITDLDGDGGWVKKYLLSNYRTVITTDGGLIYSNHMGRAYPKYRVEKNVILGLGKCKKERCKVFVRSGKTKDSGWMDKKNLWGI
jgi:SH3-like domain-containing protein